MKFLGISLPYIYMVLAVISYVIIVSYFSDKMLHVVEILKKKKVLLRLNQLTKDEYAEFSSSTTKQVRKLRRNALLLLTLIAAMHIGQILFIHELIWIPIAVYAVFGSMVFFCSTIRGQWLIRYIRRRSGGQEA